MRNGILRSPHNSSADKPTVEAFSGAAGRNYYKLEFNERAEGHLVNFYEPESAGDHVFRWSEPVAMVRMNVPANEYEIVIDTASLRGESCPFSFKLFWNDQQIARNHVKIDGGQIRFFVDRSMFIRHDEQRLTISCKPLNAENGRRQLGMPIKWVRLNQLGKQSTEFSNPTKTRSRLWRQDASPLNLRRLLGMKSPSPNLPIWEMKLPDVSSMLPMESVTSGPDIANADTVIVSSVEINSRHGTGLLIQYLFEDFSNIATVSSHRCFHGDRVRSAVHHEVPYEQMPRHELYSMVLDWFRESPPKQAYVVPFYRTELLVAIALADLFETRVCVHVMDDQCLYENEIPDELMREAMAKSNLLLTISPEMKEAYQQRFGSKVYILPPIVPESMILARDPQQHSNADQRPSAKRTGINGTLSKLVSRLTTNATDKSTERGILIGNVWDEKWLEMLQQTIGGSGYEVDWYSNNPDAMMLNGKAEELASTGIHLQDPLWGDDLVAELRRRPYAIMPSGTLDQFEPRESVARLSLPSRVPFVTSVSQIPIVVLGSRETAAGRFVNRFELGAVVDYDANQFKAAVDRVLQPETRIAIGERAARIAPTFSAETMVRWLWESNRLRQPADNRFEDLFSGETDEKTADQTPMVDLQSFWPRDELPLVLRRLQSQGINPERVIDVGAGAGSWSRAANQVFPDADFVLIEPNSNGENEDRDSISRHSFRSLQTIDAMVGGAAAEIQFTTVGREPGLKPQGILKFASHHGQHCGGNSRNVGLDQLARENDWNGSTLLRIDVRYVEHLVLAGAADFIDANVDAVILEVTLDRKHPSARTYSELLELMDGLRFDLVDESTASRCSLTGRLLQKNLVFVKRKYEAMRRVA